MTEFFDDEDKQENPVELEARRLMDEAAERQGGFDLRNVQNYRNSTPADEEND